MIDYEKEMAALDGLVARRRKALERKGAETGERSGLLSERELKRLLKQAQRRKAKLALDQTRRAGKKAKQSAEA